MARIRTVKPEYWTSEQVMECSPTARLLFIGMWNFCDDAGIHPASSKTAKAEVFPSDDFTSNDVQALIDELIANGLLVEYEAAGKRYWQVTGWHHQKIDRPNFKYPKPSIRQPFDEHSTIDRQQIDEQSPPEGKGREGKGIGVNPTSEERWEVNGTTAVSKTDSQPSRKGIVCGLLRKAGMSDAAPHYLTDETWEAILSKRTDEEIVEVALAKMAANPGKRVGLKYIAPALAEDPSPLPRGSPKSHRKTLTEIRAETYAGLTGRTPTTATPPKESIDATRPIIDGTAQRLIA